ncbi:MAG: MgtC/SapB family protein [Anaerolineae bacterium]
MPSIEILFARFGLALVLGFLIGLERERDNPLRFAGMRTFSLISLMGATLAFLGEQFAGPWLFIIGYATLSVFALASYLRGYESGQRGVTTEIVFLLAMLLGAMVYWDMLTLAAAITVVVVFILNFKPNLKRFLKQVDRQDIWAGIEFAVVWIIVLPILPNRAYGPFNVLNPREIWLMVVLVAGINLAGYILAHVYGAQRSIGLTGILGGLISSTAVTFNFARRSSSEKEKQHSRAFAFAITVASTGMFLRILILTFITNAQLSLALVLPMLAGAVIVAVGDLLLWRSLRKASESTEEGPRGKRRPSPFALGPALQFGAIFAVVLFVSAAAQEYLGAAGIYLSSVVGGIAGLDAIALTLAKLTTNSVAQDIAVRSVGLAAGANMIFKGLIATLLGSGEVSRYVLPLFVLSAAATIAAAFLVT